MLTKEHVGFIPNYYKSATRIEGDLWAGHDGRTQEEVIVKPHTSKLIQVTFPNINYVVDTLFPELNGTVKPDAHTSSRVVQHGIVVSHEHAKKVFSSVPYDSPAPMISAKFKVENLTDRGVLLPEQTALFTEYIWNGQTLTGDELLAQVNTTNGGIKLNGKEDKDWSWYRNKDETPEGIIFAINPDLQKRLWLPADDEPLRVIPEKRHYFRASIDKALTSFSEQKPDPYEQTLWVGETASKIKLSPMIHAVIPNGPGTSIDVPGHRLGNDNQGNSPLLIAGRTNWPARLEINSMTADDEIPTHILVTFAKAARLCVTKSPKL